MLKETYVCMVLLKPFSSNEKTNVLIKHPSFKGVYFLNNLLIPRNKQMSINKLVPKYKQVKKVRKIRRFYKPDSVFAKWKEDTTESLDEAFELDWQYMKMDKFMNNPEDIETIKPLYRRFFQALKNQFLTLISHPKTYPQIPWLTFINYCKKWMVVDESLTITNLDYVFVAANFDEQNLENNDERKLCRYEFLEILGRMANIKYIESGKL